MVDQDPPKIEFPCDYPIKVLGRRVDEFDEIIFAVIERHSPGFDRHSTTVKASSKGTFTSVTVTINATGPEQLDQLHQELLATGLVQMVI